MVSFGVQSGNDELTSKFERLIDEAGKSVCLILWHIPKYMEFKVVPTGKKY